MIPINFSLMKWHMKTKWLVVLSILVGCGGSLSDEQRKKVKEGLEQNKVKKVSEAQITDEAFREGRAIAAVLEKRDPSMVNLALIDSLEKAFQVEVLNMQPNDSLLRAVEQRIIEAYTTGSDITSMSDNIQRMGADSLLYTKPIMIQNLDGAVAFSKALGVRMLKKNVILSIKE